MNQFVDWESSEVYRVAPGENDVVVAVTVVVIIVRVTSVFFLCVMPQVIANIEA